MNKIEAEIVEEPQQIGVLRNLYEMVRNFLAKILKRVFTKQNNEQQSKATGDNNNDELDADTAKQDGSDKKFWQNVLSLIEILNKYLANIKRCFIKPKSMNKLHKSIGTDEVDEEVCSIIDDSEYTSGAYEVEAKDKEEEAEIGISNPTQNSVGAKANLCEFYDCESSSDESVNATEDANAAEEMKKVIQNLTAQGNMNEVLAKSAESVQRKVSVVDIGVGTMEAAGNLNTVNARKIVAVRSCPHMKMVWNGAEKTTTKSNKSIQINIEVENSHKNLLKDVEVTVQHPTAINRKAVSLSTVKRAADTQKSMDSTAAARVSATDTINKVNTTSNDNENNLNSSKDGGVAMPVQCLKTFNSKAATYNAVKYPAAKKNSRKDSAARKAILVRAQQIRASKVIIGAVIEKLKQPGAFDAICTASSKLQIQPAPEYLSLVRAFCEALQKYCAEAKKLDLKKDKVRKKYIFKKIDASFLNSLKRSKYNNECKLCTSKRGKKLKKQLNIKKQKQKSKTNSKKNGATNSATNSAESRKQIPYSSKGSESSRNNDSQKSEDRKKLIPKTARRWLQLKKEKQCREDVTTAIQKKLIGNEAVQAVAAELLEPAEFRLVTQGTESEAKQQEDSKQQPKPALKIRQKKKHLKRRIKKIKQKQLQEKAEVKSEQNINENNVEEQEEHSEEMKIAENNELQTQSINNRKCKTVTKKVQKQEKILDNKTKEELVKALVQQLSKLQNDKKQQSLQKATVAKETVNTNTYKPTIEVFPSEMPLESPKQKHLKQETLTKEERKKQIKMLKKQNKIKEQQQKLTFTQNKEEEECKGETAQAWLQYIQKNKAEFHNLSAAKQAEQKTETETNEGLAKHKQKKKQKQVVVKQNVEEQMEEPDAEFVPFWLKYKNKKKYQMQQEKDKQQTELVDTESKEKQQPKREKKTKKDKILEKKRRKDWM